MPYSQYSDLDEFERQLYCHGKGLPDDIEIVFTGTALKRLPVNYSKQYFQYMIQPGIKDVVIIRAYNHIFSKFNFGSAIYTVNKSISLFDKNDKPALLASLYLNEIFNIDDDRFLTHFYFNAVHM